MKTKIYIVTASLSALATFAKQQGFHRANEAFSILVSPDLLELRSSGLLFVMGLMLIACAPRPSAAKTIALRLHSGAIVSFAAFAGGIAGWFVMESVLHVVNNGVTQVPVALAVSCFAILLTAVPLWAYELIQP